MRILGLSCGATAAFIAMLFWSAGLTPGQAEARYGDGFGLQPAEGAAQPGPTSFWAGSCDRGLAPAPGEAIPGGVGMRQSPMWIAGDNNSVHVNPAGPFLNPPRQVPAPTIPAHCIDHGAPVQGIPAWTHAPSWRLAPVLPAGAPFDGSATFTYARTPGDPSGNQTGWPVTLGSVDNIVVDLPAGLIGDPTAVPKCSGEEFAVEPVQCPPASQVGIAQIALRNGVSNGINDVLYPIYNLEPRLGKAAEFGIPNVAGFTTVRIEGKARTNGDFGITSLVPQIPAALDLYTQTVTLWGVPWSTAHDEFRLRRGAMTYDLSGGFKDAGVPDSGLPPVQQAKYDASWGAIRPFLSNLTECAGRSPVTRLATDSYQDPGPFTADGYPDLSSPNWKQAEAAAPPVTECAQSPFEPRATFVPSSTAADSASGLTAHIEIPQNNTPPAALAASPDDATGAPNHWRSPAGRATAQLDRTVVRLPEGMSVNPSSAVGLDGCSDSQMGVTAVGNPYTFDNSEPACPDGSKIGVVEATTPLLEGSPNLTGEVILGTPKSTDPMSGEMFRLFLVLRNEDRGVLAKVYGSSVADPVTGQLTATFDKNPRVPVENIKVRLKGGDRGVLAMPQRCGERSTVSQFTPWTAAHGGGGAVRSLEDSFRVEGDCSFGFAPALTAGMSTQAARANGVFSFRFSRDDGQQWIDGLTATLPTGLLASVRDVPLCAGVLAARGACPAGSRIGTVDASAGSGSPLVLERKGSVYLTEGYGGCAYGLVVVVPVEAGPFRGPLALSDVVVRQRVCVDPVDAHVTAISDQLPIIHHGVPLRVRSVTVNVDRPRFMLNPSDCRAERVVGDFSSPQGTAASRATLFQVARCGALPFRPKLALRLTGRKQVKTGRHPGVRAVVTQKGVGEAGIERAQVRLPKSLALDPDNAQALCEFEDGTKPALENHCPADSIVGRARAVTPLLKRPLVGNVYFVKNVRRSSSGNLIRTLPMLIVALRGEIAVNLKGASNVGKAGKLVNTFDNVPDAPISRFNLNIKGGSKGILAVTRTRRSTINLCSGRHIAESDMDGQNGRRHDFNARMRTPCPRPKRLAGSVDRRRR